MSELFDVDESLTHDEAPRTRPEPGPIERGPGRPDKYLFEDGERVLLSASRVAKAADDSEGLMSWFAKHGMRAFKMRDDAADTGTAVHDAVEAHIHGDTFPSPDMILGAAPDPAGAAHAFESFLAWERSEGAHYAYRATEVSFVSPTYQLGGTIDLVAESDQGYELIDYKTSSRLRASHILQLAIYAELWEEQRDQQIVAVGALHLPKEAGRSAHLLSVSGTMFDAARAMARHAMKMSLINLSLRRSLPV